MKNVQSESDTWFLAYDIRETRRLHRVQRLARREGVALQYSGFVVNGDAAHIESLIQKLAVLIDPKLDDIRAYHLPARCQVWSLGRQSWPADICLTGQGALSVLLNATHDTAEGHEIT